MSVVIILPACFRDCTNGCQEITLEGKSFLDVLRRLIDQYPKLENQLLQQDGGLQEYLEVYVNQKHYSADKLLNLELKDNDELYVIFPFAGG